MITLDFPTPKFRFKTEADKEWLWDGIRKKWVIITPEEWVRQNFIQYLLQVKGYPASLIAIEKEIVVNKLRKRFDILIYDNLHKPFMIVECKSTTIQLTDHTIQQILRYQSTAQANYMIITNGGSTFCWKLENGTLLIQDSIPQFST